MSLGVYGERSPAKLQALKQCKLIKNRYVVAQSVKMYRYILLVIEFIFLQEEQQKMATQLGGAPLPISQVYRGEKARPVTDEERKYSVFTALRQARANKRLFGIREKKAREAAEQER